MPNNGVQVECHHVEHSVLRFSVVCMQWSRLCDDDKSNKSNVWELGFKFHSGFWNCVQTLPIPSLTIPNSVGVTSFYKFIVVLASCLGKKTVELSITADNQILELYFDGKPVNVQQADWNVVRKVSFPIRTRTIAVKCLDTGVSLSSIASWFCFVLDLKMSIHD